MFSKRKLILGIFIGLCMLLVMVPSVCMIFARSDEAVGNESQVKWPSVTQKDGSVNTDILSDMGNYFEKHFAFRPALITADARIQSSVFRVSNTDSVVTGKNGWLYYSSTLNDYLGMESLSERGLWNFAHNLALMQDYAKSHGAKFLVMIPPNKNSLYGSNMPYYDSIAASDEHNRDHLKEVLEDAGVNYLDLFELFGQQSEVLYLAQDSHWNNKGALMVYNAALDLMGKDHETYENAALSRGKTHAGDLSAMIYPSDKSKEYDFTYDIDSQYVFDLSLAFGNEVSVEDFRIESSNVAQEDILLMYRDSFGNTLIPFMANTFGKAFFSKSVPANLVSNMDTYSPDYVIVERVERSLSDYATTPALMPAKQVAGIEGLTLLADYHPEVKAASADINWLEFSGMLPEGIAEAEDSIFAQITDESGSKVYEAYTVTVQDSDYGYLFYLPAAELGSVENASRLQINIYIGKTAAGKSNELVPAEASAPRTETSETPAESQTHSPGAVEVSRVAIPSCADSQHGYYEITYSDGTVEYEEY